MPQKPFISLAESHPEIAAEADGWDPSKFTFGSEKLVKWKCPKGHSYFAPIQKRTKRNAGCQICRGKLALPGFNDLLTTHPNIAIEAYNWNPKNFTRGSSKKLQWLCSLGHIYDARITDRTKGSGCSICAGKKVLQGFNDLLSQKPLLAAEADGWDPSKFTTKSGQIKNWRCNLGHSWKAAIRHRANGTKCPYCNGQKVLVGFNDLATTYPQIALEANNWNPKELTANSGKIREWKCSKNHIWKSRVIHRKEGVGCPSCAEYGYNPGKDAFLYLIENRELKLYKIGITNSPKSRLAKHLNRGWVLLEIQGPMDGLIAQNWETLILKMLKSKGADLSNEKIAGKFDGYSEAWRKASFHAKSIKELMQMTEEFEDSEKQQILSRDF